MKIVITILVIILSGYLFTKASGTLKPNFVNIVSFAFYSIVVFEYIGVSLTYIGFREHYLIQKIYEENIIDITYYAMVAVMILLPLIIILCNKYIYKIKDIEKEYICNVKKEVALEDKEKQDKIFIVIILLFIICMLATIYVFSCIGYVSLFKFLDENFDFSFERVRISRNFLGNEYIKNLIMLTITPFISYISYLYMRITREKRWTILFILLFILNLFVKTYDFEKAPIIYYICYFFVIEALLGKILNFKKVIHIVLVVFILVIVMYCTIGNYTGSLLSLSNGPLSRTVITQAGTLFLHFDTFPSKIDYLVGHSFPPFTKLLFGDGEYDVRSGREVIEIYNKQAVKDGTAGVMSTIFIGEAYANFGYIGIIISIIIVGFIFSSILCIYLKSKKEPLNIVLYLECFIIFTTVLQAGFIDFLYNIQFLAILLIWLFIKFFIKYVEVIENYEVLVNNMKFFSIPKFKIQKFNVIKADFLKTIEKLRIRK